MDFILIIDFYSVSDMICLQKRRRYVLIWRHSNIQKLCREDRTGKETEKIQLVTQSVEGVVVVVVNCAIAAEKFNNKKKKKHQICQT